MEIPNRLFSNVNEVNYIRRQQTLTVEHIWSTEKMLKACRHPFPLKTNQIPFRRSNRQVSNNICTTFAQNFQFSP